MEIKIAKMCSCKKFPEEWFKFVMFPLVILIISTIFAVILTYLVKDIINDTLTMEGEIYFSLVIIASCMILVTLFCIFAKIISTACCEIKIKE